MTEENETPNTPEGMEIEEHDPQAEGANVQWMRERLGNIEKAIEMVSVHRPGATYNLGECNDRIVLIHSVSKEEWAELSGIPEGGHEPLKH